MGKKLAVVSFLCGGLSSCRKNPPQNPIDNPKSEDSDSTSSLPSQGGGVSSPELQQSTNNAQPPNEEDQQNLPLPPPPGRLQPQHMRAASYHHHHRRSTSGGLSRLTSSLSMKLGSSSEREKNKKKLEHEDSIWKKTIILGEKCRVPDEDDDTVLYDEKGNRISTYHPKNNNVINVGSVSRQKSGKKKAGKY